MAIAETIFATIFDRVLKRILQNDVPVTNAEAGRVASEVTKEVAPIVVNATNSEPWFRSRIYIGLIAAGLGAIAQHFGVQISGSDLQLFTNSIPELVQLIGSLFELLGLLYAAYGRIRGASLKPLGQ